MDVDSLANVVFKPNPGPQTAFLAASEREVLYGGSAGAGKGFKPTESVLTPSGWKQLGSLSVGDTICDVHGGSQKITEYHKRGVKPFFKITFADRSVIECDEDHLWSGHFAGLDIDKRLTVSTKDLFKHYSKPKFKRFGIPVTKPVQFDEEEFLLLHPYVLGVLLGDGCISKKGNAVFTTEDYEIAERVFSSLGADVHVVNTSDKRCPTYRVKATYVNPAFNKYGLWGTKSDTKFIPKAYLFSSVRSRIALLQGLMDTDGYVETNDVGYFISTSEQLIDDVRHIARSLGCLVYKTKCSDRNFTYKGEYKTGKTAWRLRIKTNTPEILFHLSRKRNKVLNKRFQSMDNWITSIEPIEPAESICITVSCLSSLFIVSDFIVTHNSYAMLTDPLRYISHPQFSGLLLRHTTEELRELVSKSQDLYPKVIPGIKWVERKMQWETPKGGRLWMSYLDADRDVSRYQGQSFCWVGFDELTQWPTPYPWNYMRSRLRSTSPDLPLYMRASTNPGNRGHAWVKKMFIDPAPVGQAFWATDIETGDILTYPKNHSKAGQPLFKRRFIPAKLKDNPYLYADGEYETNLLSLPDHERKRLLDGDWDVSEGAAFSEFKRSIHVVDPHPIPNDWTKFRACDYGYGSHTCVLWMAVAPDESIIVYRELYVSKVLAEDLADMVLAAEQGEHIRYGVLDSSCWAKRGDLGPSIAERMIVRGCKWRPSDRSAGSRVAGKNEVHRRLQVDSFTGRPRIVFFNNCTQIIADLPLLPIDKNNPEDVDTKVTNDHSYDALRYGLMSRPRSKSIFDFDNNSFDDFHVADKTLGY